MEKKGFTNKSVNLKDKIKAVEPQMGTITEDEQPLLTSKSNQNELPLRLSTHQGDDELFEVAATVEVLDDDTQENNIEDSPDASNVKAEAYSLFEIADVTSKVEKNTVTSEIAKEDDQLQAQVLEISLAAPVAPVPAPEVVSPQF